MTASRLLSPALLSPAKTTLLSPIAKFEGAVRDGNVDAPDTGSVGAGNG
jgi:hypothetical protein